jgi:type VI protein secretion system component VasF
LKIKGFKLNKNKRFNYTPRYYEGKDVGNIYSFDSKFTKYRETTNSGDIGAQWKEARNASRNRGNREINTRLLIIIAVLVFLVLWFFDFDISFFIPGK